VRFPNTLLAWLFLPLWLVKKWLLLWRRFTLRGSTVHRWYDEVDPAIVLGGALFPGDMEALRLLGVGAVLSLCAEYLDDPHEGVHMHRIPVHDDLAASDEQLVEAVSWIEERVASGTRVYVHCAAGRGRSVSVVCAWLVQRYDLSTDDALRRVQSARPMAKPTPWQLAAVRRLEPVLRAKKR
jgi:atypical dual specificity phosphatase